jgi:hypothetical protein
MGLGITEHAARLVIDCTRAEIAKLGGDQVPTIAWIVGDTDARRTVPRLAAGIAEREQVTGRRLPCPGADHEVFQALPEDILREYEFYNIDVKNDQLVFVKSSD